MDEPLPSALGEDSHGFAQSYIGERCLLPSLRPSAYKLKVGGVSSRCGIEQIHEGLHLKQTIPFKGEVRPSTYIYIYNLLLSL